MYFAAEPVDLVLWCWSEGYAEGIAVQASVEGITMQFSVEGMTMSDQYFFGPLVLVRGFYRRNRNSIFCGRNRNAILCGRNDNFRPKDQGILYLQPNLSLVLWCWSEGSIEGIIV